MDRAQREAALTAVVEGGMAHLTVSVLQVLDDSFDQLQKMFSEASVTAENSDRMLGASVGVATCRILLQDYINRTTVQT